MRRWLSWMVGVALFVAALWIGWSFRSGNDSSIPLDLLWIRISEVEIWRAVLVSIGFGALGAGILVGFAWFRAWLLNRRYRATIRHLEKELHQLRSLPLASHAVDATERS